MPINRKQLALVHIAKNQLGWDDDTYRDVLKVHGGVESSKDLTPAAFRRVMAHAGGCGFKSQSKMRMPKNHRPNMATDAQLRKIYKMWWLLEGRYYNPGKKFAALREFLKKRFRVNHENFLTFDTAHQVIEAIKAIGVREGAPIH